MSHTTIHQAQSDPPLRNRVQSAVAREAWANPALGATPAGEQIQKVGPLYFLEYFIWPIAIDNEAAYAFAVDSDNPNPGGDPSVITDAALSSGVQAHWPNDWVPPPA